MVSKSRWFLTLAMFLCFAITTVAQEDSTPPENPLADFSRLIGGGWYLEDSYQTFAWGVGKKSVLAKGYFMVEGEARLVSEGMWFWHPGEQAIKGYFTAINMPFDFFAYTSRFEGNTMINTLVTHAPDGSSETYEEIWEFTGEDVFEWALFTLTGEERQQVMGGTYNRKEY